MKKNYCTNLFLIFLIACTILIFVANAYATNIALNQPTSASGEYWPATNGNDGDTATHWNGGAYNAWWMVDLQSSYAINTVIVFGEGSLGYKLDFTIDYSLDKISWTPLGSGSSPSKPAWSEVFALSGSPLIRYIRYNVNPITAGDHDWAYLGELQALTETVPEPATMLLLGLGLIGLAGLKRKFQK